jgi:hypothetical protein
MQTDGPRFMVAADIDEARRFFLVACEAGIYGRVGSRWVRRLKAGDPQAVREWAEWAPAPIGPAPRQSEGA